MQDTILKKITGITFFAILFLVLLLSVLLPDADISKTERRHLAQMPEVSLKTVLNGEYMTKMDTYLADQIAGRDIFRSIKAETELLAMRKLDAGGYFKEGDILYKLEDPYNEKNVKRAAQQFTKIVENYFDGALVSYAIIPDKSFFLPKETDYPKLDFLEVEQTMAEYMKTASYIPLRDCLEREDYYRSDLHWRQECLDKVAQRLTGAEETYEIETATENFRGGYAGASAILTEPEELNFVTSPVIENALLYDYEEKQYRDIYAWEKLDGADAYDFYLWGARALLTIENTKWQGEEKNLILFRDSFASSLTPWLLSSYTKITLVDLRYVTAEYAMELLREDQYQEVLFLYSANMLNHSDSMKL